MSEMSDGPDHFIAISTPDAVTYTENGTIIEARALTCPDASPDDIRETAGDVYGVDPRDVRLPGDNNGPRAGRTSKSYGFGSKWNAPWTPAYDKSRLPADPTQN
jgi:hypothetical protein